MKTGFFYRPPPNEKTTLIHFSKDGKKPLCGSGLCYSMHFEEVSDHADMGKVGCERCKIAYNKIKERENKYSMEIWEAIKNKKRFCYTIDETQLIKDTGGFVATVVVEGESTSTIVLDENNMPEVWGSTIEKAKRKCVKENMMLGIDVQAQEEIIKSTKIAA